jgi:hypothetical protein
MFPAASNFGPVSASETFQMMGALHLVIRSPVVRY